MDKTTKNESGFDPDDEWLDDTGMFPRGDADPYLAEIARMSRDAAHPDSGCGPTSSTVDWNGHDRRSNAVDCYDPYVVELARTIRSEF